jgi:hypothetical protein
MELPIALIIGFGVLGLCTLVLSIFAIVVAYNQKSHENLTVSDLRVRDLTLQDKTDNTKQLSFDVSRISTNTKRKFYFSDADFDTAGVLNSVSVPGAEYSTVSDAINAGESSIRVISSVTETTSVIISNKTVNVFVNAGVTLDFSSYRVGLESGLISFVGESVFPNGSGTINTGDSIVKMSPSVNTGAFYGTSQTVYGQVLFNNIVVKNETSTDDRPIFGDYVSFKFNHSLLYLPAAAYSSQGFNNVILEKELNSISDSTVFYETGKDNALYLNTVHMVDVMVASTSTTNIATLNACFGTSVYVLTCYISMQSCIMESLLDQSAKIEAGSDVKISNSYINVLYFTNGGSDCKVSNSTISSVDVSSTYSLCYFTNCTIRFVAGISATMANMAFNGCKVEISTGQTIAGTYLMFSGTHLTLPDTSITGKNVSVNGCYIQIATTGGTITTSGANNVLMGNLTNATFITQSGARSTGSVSTNSITVV